MLFRSLSAARSVLQYAREEAKNGQAGGLAWYDQKVSGDKVLRFLKDKRDLNIHHRPLKPAKHVLLRSAGRIYFTGSLGIEIHRSDGSAEIREDHDEPTPLKSDAEESWRETRWYFHDWPGSDDVVSLCSQYLAALTQFVDEGIRMAMISG